MYVDWLCKYSIYCVTPSHPSLSHDDYVHMVSKACEGGCHFIQLRNKYLLDKDMVYLAITLQDICRRYSVAFVINDRVDIALIAGTDGIHVGQDDISVKDVKNIIHTFSSHTNTRKPFVGCSTHSMEQALQAEKDGADYIAIGPIFKTPTKENYIPVGLSLLQQFSQMNRPVPYVAIGGINDSNVDMIYKSGAKSIAVVRSAFKNGTMVQNIKLFHDRIKYHNESQSV